MVFATEHQLVSLIPVAVVAAKMAQILLRKDAGDTILVKPSTCFLCLAWFLSLVVGFVYSAMEPAFVYDGSAIVFFYASGLIGGIVVGDVCAAPAVNEEEEEEDQQDEDMDVEAEAGAAVELTPPRTTTAASASNTSPVKSDEGNSDSSWEQVHPARRASHTVRLAPHADNLQVSLLAAASMPYAGMEYAGVEQQLQMQQQQQQARRNQPFQSASYYGPPAIATPLHSVTPRVVLDFTPPVADTVNDAAAGVINGAEATTEQQRAQRQAFVNSSC